MKKKILKFITAALAVSACLTSSVFASVAIGTNGYVSSNETTLTIPKGVLMKNDLSGTNQFYGPDVDYTFSVEPATPPAGATVSSNSAVTNVHPGVADSVTISTTPDFDSELVDFTSAGTESQELLTLSVDVTKFTKPGVYRYLITDTTPASVLYATGIVRSSDYQTTRYLDVFIERDTDSTYKVAGYVLMKNNPATNAEGTIQKSVGFIEGDNLGSDAYKTYNVTLEKDVEGSMGDRTHEFPFAIGVNNNNYTYFWAENETDLTQYATTALTSATLKHGDIIYIRGLNPHATVAYTETIDVDDIYNVKATGASNSTLVAEAAKTNTETTVLAASAVTTYETVNSTSAVTTDPTLNNVSETTFVNTLEAVSPTGVVLRFAP